MFLFLFQSTADLLEQVWRLRHDLIPGLGDVMLEEAWLFHAIAFKLFQSFLSPGVQLVLDLNNIVRLVLQLLLQSLHCRLLQAGHLIPF